MLAIANRSLFYATGSFLAAALLLGGGRDSAPWHNLIIELLGIGLLLFVFLKKDKPVPGFGGALALLLLVLIIAIPVLQLIPLPYSWWSALPGRELAVAIDGQLGVGGGHWRPLSLAPESTWQSLLSLVAPAAIFCAVLHLGAQDRRVLVFIVIACAFASAMIGLLQVANPGSAFSIYGGSHSAYPTGLFINRNHQADFLLIAMIFSVAIVAHSRRLSVLARWALAIAVVAALSVGVIVTTSRMGLLLLPVAIGAALVQFPRKFLVGHRVYAFWAILCLVVVAGFVSLSDGAGRTLQRFNAFSDVRFEYWVDAIFAARQYFPWGSGLGTFDPVYRAIENLNQVGPNYVNLAHNDYVQILIETGLFGCALIVLFLVLYAWLALRHADAALVPYRTAAAFSIFIILLHSVVDYPLRTLNLLSLFGLLCAFLIPVGRERLVNKGGV